MAKPVSNDDSAADKLGKILPAEVTGLYISLRSIFTTTVHDYAYYLIAAAVVSLIAGLIYISVVRGVRNPTHILVYAIIFLVWALTVDAGNIEEHFGHDLPIQNISAALSILISFLAPVLIPNGLLVPRSAVNTLDPIVIAPVAPSKP